MKTPNSLIWKEKPPTPAMLAEIAALPSLSVNELRDKFAEVLGYGTGSRNRQFLIRKLTWGIQARQWGDISPEARARAHELADFRFLRVRFPKDMAVTLPDTESARVKRIRVAFARDPRLPMPGAMIMKEHEGRQIAVRVLEDGFEFEGRRYRSLSAIAKEATGTNWNGFIFFGLGGGK
jgi:hypothetical protein